MAKPRTIHDLFGFGPRLQTFQYPAPGSPEIAREIRDALKPRFVGLDEDAWGIDHGTWSVMAHVFPEANVPVIQLSINGTKDFACHLDIGARLAPLRERGILIIGSGNVRHCATGHSTGIQRCARSARLCITAEEYRLRSSASRFHAPTPTPRVVESVPSTHRTPCPHIIPLPSIGVRGEF